VNWTAVGVIVACCGVIITNGLLAVRVSFLAGQLVQQVSDLRERVSRLESRE
jgi:hypothetical protein